ncbi:MAG: T9SS type A sorting domain-containing protein, partial [Bacteroidetes bacterium]|nr:T9SS type A sorting domain-containing protein [Bacteroidota bacterium]
EKIVSVAPDALNIYPNPATSEFHVDGMSSAGLASISTITGREVISHPLAKGSNTITLKNLKAGIYLLRCSSRDGIYNGKLIVR